MNLSGYEVAIPGGAWPTHPIRNPMGELAARALGTSGFEATGNASRGARRYARPFTRAVLIGTPINASNVEEIANPLTLSKEDHIAHASPEVHDPLRHRWHVGPAEQPIRVDHAQWIALDVCVSIDAALQPDGIGLGVDPTRREFTVPRGWPWA